MDESVLTFLISLVQSNTNTYQQYLQANVLNVMLQTVSYLFIHQIKAFWFFKPLLWSVCVDTLSVWYMWRTEHLVESVLPFQFYVSSRDWTHIVRLVQQLLLLTEPSCWINKNVLIDSYIHIQGTGIFKYVSYFH